MRQDIMTEDEKKSFDNALNKLKKLPIHITDNLYDFYQIKSQLRSWKKYDNVSIVIYDYVQLIGFGKEEKTFERVSKVSRNLKILAKSLKICNIVLSQIKRDAQNRKPSLSDLRASGNLEQDADSVIFLWQESNGDKEKYVAGIRNQLMMFRKNRHGMNFAEQNIQVKNRRYLSDREIIVGQDVFEINEKFKNLKDEGFGDDLPF